MTGAEARMTLAAPARHEIEVKHSRFVAFAEPVGSVEAALEAIARHSDPDATHNCWAYRVGQSYRFNDDGEPGGSAGAPILKAIDGQKLDRVAVLVVRYYGGIKLGAGGLVRAYGGCAAECLRTANKETIIQYVTAHISCSFSLMSQIRALLARHGAPKASEQFEADGVTLRFDMPQPSVPALERDLATLSRGTITLRIEQD